MELTREDRLERFYARDAACDGRFVVGVVTTGIYCLPSCPARKPRRENVRLFDDEAGAVASGLRPCKRCRPDRFYRGLDPDRELVRALARRVRAAPGEHASVAALARAAGVGATKLGALVGQHLHAAPAAFLQRARVDHAARALLRGDAPLVDVALEAGFESASVFHEAFRRWTGMAPGAYRRMLDGDELELALPPRFRTDDLFALFGRCPEGACERVDGSRAVKAVHLVGTPARLELDFAPGSVRARVVLAEGAVGRERMAAAHAVLARLLGLASDPAPFERRALRDPRLAPLVRARRGLRIPQTADAFEGLVWVVVGQQVNLGFAATCRARLVALAGAPAGAGFVAHPTPAVVAQLEPEDLVRLQFSRRKAEVLVGAARAIESGELPLEELRAVPATVAAETLGAVHGLGPWSVQYLLLRALGFADCVPVGDAGLGRALQRVFELPERPDAARTLALLDPYAPHRSLATFHLWKSLEDSA